MAGCWLCRPHTGPSTGGGKGLEEPAGLDGPQSCLKLMDEAPWWPSLWIPASLPSLRAPGPMGPVLSPGLPTTLKLQCLRAKNQYEGPRG